MCGTAVRVKHRNIPLFSCILESHGGEGNGRGGGERVTYAFVKVLYMPAVLKMLAQTEMMVLIVYRMPAQRVEREKTIRQSSGQLLLAFVYALARIQVKRSCTLPATYVCRRVLKGGSDMKYISFETALVVHVIWLA